MSKSSLPFVESESEEISESLPESTRSEPAVSAEPKPEKSRLETEWDAHLEGVKARQAMADQPDVDAKALMQAMLTSGKVDGKTVPVLDAVVLLLTQDLATLLDDDDWKWIGGERYQMGVMPWICLFPDEAFELFESGDFINAKRAVFALNKKIKLKELTDFNDWVHEQLSLMNESESEKKGKAVKKQAKRAARR